MLALHQKGYRLIACVQSPVDDLGALGDEQTLLQPVPVEQLGLGEPGIYIQFRRGKVRDFNDIGHMVLL